jgi:hypothetical protein
MLSVIVYQFAIPILVLLIFLRWDRQKWFGQWSLPIIFFIGIFVQGWMWWHSVPALNGPDSQGYFRLAHDLETDLRTILYRPKLYPIFLQWIPTLKVVSLIQAFLKIGIGLFLIRMGSLFDWRKGLIAWVLLLFMLNSLWLSECLNILDTTLFTFLFTGFLWLGLETYSKYSRTKFISLCILAGLVTLTRQVADIGMICAIAWLVVKELKSQPNRWKAVLVGLSLGALLAVSGAISNGFQNGVWKRSVALGVNLYTRSAYYQLADLKSPEWDFCRAYLPLSQSGFESWDPHFTHDIPWPVMELPHQLERAMGVSTVSEILGNDAILTQHFFQWIRDNPGIYFQSVINEIARLGLKAEDAYPNSLLREFFPVAPWMIRIERGMIHQSLLWLSLVGIVGCSRKYFQGKHLFLGVGLFGYLVLLPLITLGFTRYGLPAYPALLIWAGNGLNVWMRIVPRPWTIKEEIFAKPLDSGELKKNR